MSWKRTVWFRLTVGSVAIVLVANAVLSLVILLFFSGTLAEEVQTRVRLDLNSARKVYDRHIHDICLLMQATSARRSVPTPLEDWKRKDLHRLLQHIRQAGKLDMLSLLDTNGQVIYREHNPGQHGDDASYNPIVSRALREKQCMRGTAIVPYEKLLVEGALLTHRAALRIRSGEKALHRDAMVIGAAVTLVDLERGGDCVGYLYGARLLNRSYGIVDEIKEELYQNEIFQGKAIGAATVFHEDIRVSTSLKGADGSRSIGTLLSPAVHDKVLKQRENFADRAFAVDNWYITAYEPIRDPEGRVIGALGVGVLEAPFTRTRRLALGVFLGVVAFTTLVSLVLLTFATRAVLRPIGRIVEMSDRVTAGDLSARVKMRPPGELGLLCRAIDQMADAVAQREKALEQTTRRQIGQSEKLATVGRMAAGIAHEINNPLTGLLTFEHLLKDEKDLSPKAREYLEIMYQETSRMREIVMGLLNFSRESSAEMTSLDINEVIRQWLTLLRSQKEFDDIFIEERLADNLPKVLGDANQLQQVLVNLSLNACEAMPDGGTLTITTRKEGKNVLVSIADTGCGIKAEHLEMIFDPFFTTKPVGKGTGLGLSVSYGIIRQHGGVMQVESREGRGTTFAFTLPAAKED
jgi:two-component system NtrC family sensor kinase